ncbi:hypothetical protein M9Y10_018962 [Tritrichomonas musculus]|uniref:Uncharacterized protein n=1 Tax=Tritrichomonas musculus TaxID=1915356 RepID=A0ABR2HJE7_9EUKA
MILLITLIFFGKSNDINSKYDVRLNLNLHDWYLIIQNDIIEFRDDYNSKFNPNSIIFQQNNSINKQIYLNIGGFADRNQNHKLYLISNNSIPVNLSFNITSLNTDESHFEISFLPGFLENKEVISLNIYVNDPDFLHFTNIRSQFNLKVFNSGNGQLVAQLLPEKERKKIIICYGGTECTEQEDFSIQTDGNYLSLIDDNNFENVINNIIISSKIEYLKIYFASEKSPKVDFSMIPFKHIQKVYIIGHSIDNPQIIKINNQDQNELIDKIEAKNAQIVTKDEKFNTKSSFKNESPRALIKYTPTENQIVYNMNIDLVSNPNITFLVKQNSIDSYYTAEGDKEYIIFSNGKETVIVIENASSTFDKKILIECNVVLTNIVSNNISFLFKNCGNITIEFTKWVKKEGEKEVTPVMFNFYSEKSESLNIISSKNRLIKYRHLNIINLENSNITDESLFKQYPTAFAFCLQDVSCDEKEYIGLDPVIIPIKDISSIEGKFDEISNQNLKNLIFFFDEKSKNDNIDLSFLTGSVLEQVKFISYVADVPLTVTGIKGDAKKNWTITNCTITIKTSSDYVIDELFSNYASISRDEEAVNSVITIKHGTYLMKVDLTEQDLIFVISNDSFRFKDYDYHSNDNLTMKIETQQNANTKFIFQPADILSEKTVNTTDICLNFEGTDENITYIPISFGDWSKSDGNLTILINTNSSEQIIFDNIPQNLNFVVYSNETKSNVQQIYSDASKIVMCYESDECVKQDDFSQSIDRYTTFISLNSTSDYDKVIQSIDTNDYDNKPYDYLRLVFIGKEDPINLTLNDNISDNFDQIQLYGYNNARILLDDNINTCNFKVWVVHHVSFMNNSNINYTFNELIIIDTEPIFQNLFEISNNIYIGTARFYCEEGYKVNGLSGVDNINCTIFEIFPNLEEKDYVLSIRGYSFIANSNTENGAGSPFINAPQSKFYFNVHTPSNYSTGHKFVICRYENRLSQISINLENINYTIPFPVQYTCKDNECDKPFKYKFTTENFTGLANDSELLIANQGECNYVITMINGIDALPTPCPSTTPTQSFTEIFSLSSMFSSSAKFTFSSMFSRSLTFTKSSSFTESTIFTNSLSFSNSNLFSDSFMFTNSCPFSNSLPFSETNIFSSTLIFSLSSVFTLSSSFSISKLPATDDFTESEKFTRTSLFSKSSLFTSSHMFTPSYQFTPSYPFQHDQPEIDDSKPDFNLSLESININSNGIIEVDDGKTINLNNSNVPFISVLFKNDITVTESDVFSLPTTLYFIADEPNRRIKFDEKLINSSIGVKTDKSPTVVLTNDKTPLNIMNYKQGYSWIDIEYESDQTTTSLKLNEVNNSNGYLTLNVESNIRSISFTSLIMSRISSIEIKNKNKNQNQNQDQRNNNNNNNNKIIELEEVRDNNICELAVEDNINISSRSSVTLSKIRLEGNINMNDDSIIIFREETKFEDSSNISIRFGKNKDTRREPIIKFDGLLDSTPNQITLSFEDKSTISDFSNFILIEGTNFRTCFQWIDKLQLVNNGKKKIESRCDYKEGGLTHLIISKQKSKKLSTGAIIGIVIGIVVVLVIIIIVVLLVKRKKTKDKSLHEVEEFNDDSTF